MPLLHNTVLTRQSFQKMIFIVLSILLGFIKMQQYFYVGRNDLECGIPFSWLGLEIYIIQKKPKMNLSRERVCHMSKEEMLAQMSSVFFFFLLEAV